jgi:hypothetical protein
LNKGFFSDSSGKLLIKPEQKILDCIHELEMERIVIDPEKLNARLREKEGLTLP